MVDEILFSSFSCLLISLGLGGIGDVKGFINLGESIFVGCSICSFSLFSFIKVTLNFQINLTYVLWNSLFLLMSIHSY